jgi:hypothetical protein
MVRTCMICWLHYGICLCETYIKVFRLSLWIFAVRNYWQEGVDRKENKLSGGKILRKISKNEFELFNPARRWNLWILLRGFSDHVSKGRAWFQNASYFVYEAVPMDHPSAKCQHIARKLAIHSRSTSESPRATSYKISSGRMDCHFCANTGRFSNRSSGGVSLTILLSSNGFPISR